MKTKTVELFEFDELPEAIKSKIVERERWINTEDALWDDFLLDDWKEKLTELGFDDPDISFTGFGSQGDGASFTCKRVDVALFLAKQKAKGRFKALLKAIKSGEAEVNVSVDSIDHHYSHEYTIKAYSEVYFSDDENDAVSQQADELADFVLDVARTLSRQIYRELEKEYFYLTSDEAIIETIKANEYTFTESGRMEND